MLKQLFLAVFLLTLASLAALSLTTETQIPASFLGGQELSSPSDWVKENQILVYPTKVIINLKEASWAKFTDTNSMDPFLDAEANAIEIKPSSPDLVKVGDIISYKTNYGIIIHRVVEKGIDQDGFYFIVRGDNNKLTDPQKVRFEQIKGVVVAIIY